MRTKVLLGLAALAVGLSTSMAQVYSLNVVGYYNITVPSGYSLHANQLNTGTNGINQVLTGAPDNAFVLTFANNDYVQDLAVGGQWYDSSANPSTTVLPPGKGWFYNNPGATSTLTLVGEVPQGSVSVPLPSGYGLVGTYTPQALPLDATSNFPMLDNLFYLKFDTTIGDYVQYLVVGGGWYDSSANPVPTPTPGVGDGYFINNPGASTSWTRNFTVN